MFDRRQLLTGIGALVCAPAIVRAASLMPVKAYATQNVELLMQIFTDGHSTHLLCQDVDNRAFVRIIPFERTCEVTGFVLPPIRKNGLLSCFTYIAPKGNESALLKPSLCEADRLYLDYRA